MSGFGPFRLISPAVRESARKAILEAPDGHWVEIKDRDRTLEQNAAAHAALSEIAKHVTIAGKHLSVLVWKRLTMAAFLREIGEAPEMYPALDGDGFDIVYEHTSDLGVKKFSAWMDWIFKHGAEHGVVFKDGNR